MKETRTKLSNTSLSFGVEKSSEPSRNSNSRRATGKGCFVGNGVGAATLGAAVGGVGALVDLNVGGGTVGLSVAGGDGALDAVGAGGLVGSTKSTSS